MRGHTGMAAEQHHQFVDPLTVARAQAPTRTANAQQQQTARGQCGAHALEPLQLLFLAEVVQDIEDDDGICGPELRATDVTLKYFAFAPERDARALHIANHQFDPPSRARIWRRRPALRPATALVAKKARFAPGGQHPTP